MAFQFVAVERDGPVAVVVLNRPDKGNVLSIALRSQIDTCLGELTRWLALGIALRRASYLRVGGISS